MFSHPVSNARGSIRRIDDDAVTAGRQHNPHLRVSLSHTLGCSNRRCLPKPVLPSPLSLQAQSSSDAVPLTDVDAEHAKTLENRANWYEAKWCAIDQPEWNAATFLTAKQETRDMRIVSLEVEISRERVALLNAYKRVGQMASIRVNNGVEYQVKPATAPFAEALNKQPLYIVRGDQSAYDIKTATELTSVKATLDVLVTEKTCPDLYALQDADTPIDVGPFKGPGLRMRDSALAIYRYGTVVMFVEGEGIATARALIEATEDIPNLSLPFRDTVHLYYKAPNDESFVFEDRFAAWEEKGCKVITTTQSFQDAFDDDSTLIYEPLETLAVVLTGGDAENEKEAVDVCKEAEITCVVRESEEDVETMFVRTGSGQV